MVIGFGLIARVHENRVCSLGIFYYGRNSVITSTFGADLRQEMA